MFSKLRNNSASASAPPADGSAVPQASSTTAPAATASEPKKSFYRRFKDAQRGKSTEISDEELKKYTGRTRAEISNWAKDREGVAGNQAAGKLDMGNTSGLGGVSTAAGYGGWGWDAAGKLKYPPEKKGEVKEAKEAKEVDDDSESE